MKGIKGFMLLLLAVVIGCATSCSDESPERNSSESWLNLMDTVMYQVWHPDVTPWTGLDQRNFGFHIMFKDKAGNDLLENMQPEDFYVEYDGVKYVLGDTVPLPENSRPLRIIDHYNGRGKIIAVTTEMWKPEYVTREPIDYTFTFVWPAKNIRRTYRVYVEFNKNLWEDVEAMRNELVADGRESGDVDCYYIIRWVDGQIHKPSFKDWDEIIVE